MIDAINRGLEIRRSIINCNELLVVDFSDTLEGKDSSKIIELMPISRTNKYPFRTKVNIKELDKIACNIYNKEFFDTSKKSDKEIEDFVKRKEFDFPLWYKNTKGFEMKKINQYNNPFILQVAGCNFHGEDNQGGCKYCFVDDSSNDAKISNAKIYLNINKTIESFIEARQKIKEIYSKNGQDMDLKVFRISGGEPTIALDWALNILKGFEKNKIDVCTQIDTNLSTGRLIDNYEKTGVFEKYILEHIANYNVKVLTAIKGVSDENLTENIMAYTNLEEQTYSLKKIIKAGLDIYPQMYNPNPNQLKNYLDQMDNQFENFSLKVHIGPLKVYSPTKQRLEKIALQNNLNPNEEIKKQEETWKRNYENSCNVLNDYLQDRYKLGYKDTVRSDVKIKFKSVH